MLVNVLFYFEVRLCPLARQNTVYGELWGVAILT